MPTVSVPVASSWRGLRPLPRGRSDPVNPVTNSLCFALLEHDYPTLHWDLLLERPDQERVPTWRLPAVPVVGAELTAERSFDHRQLYLEYEGPVSGDRGTVRQAARGTLVWREFSETLVAADLQSETLAGRLTLRCGSDSPGGAWKLVLESPSA